LLIGGLPPEKETAFFATLKFLATSEGNCGFSAGGANVPDEKRRNM
jgi:hypothetical protein